MAENPNFFVDVLCEVYLPANRDKDQDVEPSPQERARVQAAYRLPWFEQVRKLAVGGQQNPAVLAHAPNHPGDAAWPHRAVRGVIESLGSTRMILRDGTRTWLVRQTGQAFPRKPATPGADDPQGSQAARQLGCPNSRADELRGREGQRKLGKS
jgi:hypothetical protein